MTDIMMRMMIYDDSNLRKKHVKQFYHQPCQHMKRPDFPRLLNDQDLFGLLTTPRMGNMRALAAWVDELWTMGYPMFQQSQSDQAIGLSAKFRPYQTLKPSVYPFYPNESVGME